MEIGVNTSLLSPSQFRTSADEASKRAVVNRDSDIADRQTGPTGNAANTQDPRQLRVQEASASSRSELRTQQDTSNEQRADSTPPLTQRPQQAVTEQADVAVQRAQVNSTEAIAPRDSNDVNNTATPPVSRQQEAVTSNSLTNNQQANAATEANEANNTPNAQQLPQANAVTEAILSLGTPEPERSNVELFREQAVGESVEGTRLRPPSIVDLAVQAFEQRQAERAEDRTPEQSQLRDRLATEDNSNTRTIVDLNA